MGCDDVIRLFLLTKLVTIVMRLSFSSLSHEEVTSEPCIAENNEPPKTPATHNMWKGCIRMLCSAWKTNM